MFIKFPHTQPLHVPSKLKIEVGKQRNQNNKNLKTKDSKTKIHFPMTLKSVKVHEQEGKPKCEEITTCMSQPIFTSQINKQGNFN